MRYINATVVLPEELVEKLQDYIQGEYLYIPAKKMNIKSGESCPAHEKRLTKEIMIF